MNYPGPIKKWFGYDRKERRASFILLTLIIVLILVRYLYPVKNMDVSDISSALVQDSLSPSVSYAMLGQSGQKAGSRERPAAQRQMINLNNCDSSMLEALPGIGPVLSSRIIRYRNLIGGYASVDQLREVYGLPPETFTMIKTRVFADTSSIRKVNVNSAEYRDFDQVIYLRRSDIYAIIKFRDINKRVNGIEDLVGNKIIADSIARKVKPYLSF